MAAFKRFEEIESWRRARELTREIYSQAGQGRFAKDYGLRDQICRASVSIMSNIAEGFERDGNKEFIHYLSIAKASAGEVRSQLYVALDQSYIDQSTFEHLSDSCVEISKMISGLIKYLKQSDLKGLKYK